MSLSVRKRDPSEQLQAVAPGSDMHNKEISTVTTFKWEKHNAPPRSLAGSKHRHALWRERYNHHFADEQNILLSKCVDANQTFGRRLAYDYWQIQPEDAAS